MDIFAPLPLDQRVIYALVDPTDEKVYYVGQTRSPQSRLEQHMAAQHHQSAKGEWLRRLRQQGQQPLMHILETVTGERAALEREQEWIRRFLEQQMPLLNAQVHPRGNNTQPYSTPIGEVRRRTITPVAQKEVFIADHAVMAVLLPDGQSGAVLTMLCAMLDLQPGTQARLVRKNPVLSEALVLVTLPTPGGEQTTNVLLAWAIALWAAGLRQGTRPDSYKDLLLTIQRLAGRVIASEFAQEMMSSAFTSQSSPNQPPPPQSVWQEWHTLWDHLQGAVEGLGLEQQNVYNHLAVVPYDLHKQGRRIAALEAGHASPAGGLSDAQLGYIYRRAHQAPQRSGYPVAKILAGLAEHFRVEDVSDLPEKDWPAVLEWFAGLLEE
jgi:predicted GIY-YIG superfamily endonuclease